MGIVKYRHKRDECYKAPILDSSYFTGGPTYLEGTTTQTDANKLEAINPNKKVTNPNDKDKDKAKQENKGSNVEQNSKK
ncbi:unnamed protein product [Anisakis simplex]|uniref:Hva1_TUDOR domain-containing protein n=1 Tax=Anisakis simplex TaxID=6269 RepID=A0A0M3J3C1_ANISI|nr:unnamed protein product [Anisakis simplex]